MRQYLNQVTNGHIEWANCQQHFLAWNLTGNAIQKLWKPPINDNNIVCEPKPSF